MFCRSAGFLVLYAISATGQTLTPRELFYTPVANTTVKPPPKTAGKKSTIGPKKPPANDTTVTTMPVAYNPLGLRYSLLHSADGATYNEVDADTVFRSGDKLKVSVQSNSPAKLYVVARGSSGNWKVLFPSSEVDGGDNKVIPMQSYNIPPTGRFFFDEKAGEEKLFIVLSRKAVELEALIYDLNKSPAAPAPDKPENHMVLAQRIAPIDDALVGRLRAGVQSRDLVFEKVDEKTAGERKEKAVYVVNTKQSADARLVIDLSLKHR